MFSVLASKLVIFRVSLLSCSCKSVFTSFNARPIFAAIFSPSASDSASDRLVSRNYTHIGCSVLACITSVLDDVAGIACPDLHCTVFRCMSVMLTQPPWYHRPQHPLQLTPDYLTPMQHTPKGYLVVVDFVLSIIKM